MCHACGRRRAGTSLFNLSCSGSSSECQWRVLINSCGGGVGMRERERGYKVALVLVVSPRVSLSVRGVRWGVWSVNYWARPRQRLGRERWLVGSERSCDEQSQSETEIRGGDRDTRASLSVINIEWGYYEKCCDIITGILCAVQFFLFCCVPKRIELFW